MQEASWVRSVYLYAMCAVSAALIVIGAIAATSGLVRAVVPDLGHRDSLDRVGIGLSNIATNVVDLFEEAQGGEVADYCRDVTDNDDDFDQCVESESLGSGTMDSIQEGIAEVKSELRSQIRNSAVDQMIRGLLALVAGLLIYRIHGPRTELFAGGLMPNRPSSERKVEPTGAPPPYQDPAVYQGGRPPYVSRQDPPLSPDPQPPLPPPPGTPPGG